MQPDFVQFLEILGEKALQFMEVNVGVMKPKPQMKLNLVPLLEKCWETTNPINVFTKFGNLIMLVIK